jgi:Skp family chaperone for outer membrane proteins
METTEKINLNYVFEDRPFAWRLQRTLNAEYEKLNTLLAEHAKLLEEHRKLMADTREAVQQRWKEEEKAESNINLATATEEVRDAD